MAGREVCPKLCTSSLPAKAGQLCSFIEKHANPMVCSHLGGLCDEPLIVGTPTHDLLLTLVVARKVHPPTANPPVLRYDMSGRNVCQPRPIEETPCELVKRVRRSYNVRLRKQTPNDGAVGVGESRGKRVGRSLGLVGASGVDQEVGL